MKLATLRDGSRDGLLAVVSSDLSLAQVATGRARTLRQVLDDWNFISPQLEELSITLNQGKARHAFAFDPGQCLAPLPRAFCWAQAADPASGPGATLRHAAGQGFWAATDPAGLPASAEGVPATPGLQAHAGLAVLTGDIAAGTAATAALEGVRLLLLALHWQAAAAPGWQRTAFAPLAVTPDELGSAWQQGRVHAALQLQAAGRTQPPRPLAADEALQWQVAGFAPLLARLAADAAVPAGSLLGSGPLGAALQGLRPGDTVRLDCTDPHGASVFGSVQQAVSRGD